MSLRLLAISDTHLGEDTSVLNFAEGRARLAEALGTLFGPGCAVDELVLSAISLIALCRQRSRSPARPVPSSSCCARRFR
jgi:hypothetical protein